MTSPANELMTHDFTGEQQMQTNRKPEKRTKETTKTNQLKTKEQQNMRQQSLLKSFYCRIIVSRLRAKTIMHGFHVQQKFVKLYEAGQTKKKKKSRQSI